MTSLHASSTARRPHRANRSATNSLLRHASLICLAASLTGACASSLPPGAASLASAGATLIVVNRTFDDMVVYFAKGGSPLRVASVSGFSTREIALPPALIGSGTGARLVARRMGEMHDYVVTERLSIFSGETYVWTVGSSEATTYLIER